MKPTLLITIILIFTCGTMPQAFANDSIQDIYNEYGLSSDDIDFRLVKMQSHLNLSDKQTANLRQIFSDFDGKYKKLLEQQNQESQQIQMLLQKGQLDDKKLQALADTLGGITSQLTVLRIKNRMNMYATLNKEQRQKFQKYWRHGHGRKTHTDQNNKQINQKENSW